MSNGSAGQGTAAFRSRDFQRYQMARVMAILGAEAQSVAVAWQVYQITHRALDLGYTGLALFLPGLLFILPAGHTADRFDRRVVILVCYSLQAFCTAALFWFAWHRMHNVLIIYAVLFLIGTGRAFSGPASSALVPHLVPKEHFVNAVAWGATIFPDCEHHRTRARRPTLHAAVAREPRRCPVGLPVHTFHAGVVRGAGGFAGCAARKNGTSRCVGGGAAGGVSLRSEVGTFAGVDIAGSCLSCCWAVRLR